MRFRVAPVVLGLSIAAVAPANAQLRASRPPPQARNLPRLLVANPHTFATADSAAAVRVGSGMREKIEGIADKWYTTIQRNQMNDALQQYGYPIDAVLPPFVARTLGSQLQARAFVLGSLTRDNGKLTVEVRLLSGNDQTGQLVRMTQADGQSPEDLGGKIGESLRGAFNALPEAKNCETFSNASPPNLAKAKDAAAKALKAQPNHGPAEFCLALIAVNEKAPVDEVIQHFKAATDGDPQSLEAWGGLLGQYQAKHDTTNIVAVYQQLIQIAPGNQKVVEEAVRFFISAGKPELGEQIASDAIQRDPSNPDVYDLRATACLVQSKWKCAIGALEQVFTIDTAKADTFNLQKMIYVASQDSTDAEAYRKWAMFAGNKFPERADILGEVVKMYETLGPVDSAVSVTRRLVAIDKSDMSPVIRAVRALVKDKRYQDAIDLGQLIEQSGQDGDKTNLGLVLANEGGLPALQAQPADADAAVLLGRKAAQILPAGSRGNVLANYVLGFGLLIGLTPKDAAAVEAKSCDGVNALEAHYNEIIQALTIGQDVSESAKADVAQRIQALTAAYPPRIAQMKKAWCK
ncbi:MAG: tetratricopeptide repeat protein [Gemmatimonadales bacterium]